MGLLLPTNKGYPLNFLSFKILKYLHIGRKIQRELWFLSGSFSVGCLSMDLLGDLGSSYLPK